MSRESEPTPTTMTMGIGLDNMNCGPGTLFAMSLPFLRISQQERPEESCMARVRMADPEGGVRLEQALCGLREKFPFDCDVEFRVFVSGRERGLSPELYEQMYFISQEAVKNAFCHSAATIVEAEVMYTASALRLFVRDNGCGMDQQNIGFAGDSNKGLLEMRDRTEGIGGQFRIWSRAGAGTEIEVSVPFGNVIVN